MSKSEEWALKDVFEGCDSFYWSHEYCYCIRPNSVLNPEEYHGPFDREISGTMIDCRIPVEVRKEMATGVRDILSYQDWVVIEGWE